jgi:hypothetical protein
MIALTPGFLLLAASDAVKARCRQKENCDPQRKPAGAGHRRALKLDVGIEQAAGEQVS